MLRRWEPVFDLAVIGIGLGWAVALKLYLFERSFFKSHWFQQGCLLRLGVPCSDSHQFNPTELQQDGCFTKHVLFSHDLLL